MREDLLIKGAEILEADAVKEDGVCFNLNFWIGKKHGGMYKEIPSNVIPVDCRTSACAVGLFCLHPFFQERGLGYTHRQRGDEYILVPTFNNLQDFHAVAFLFDIDYNQTTVLFSPSSYEEHKGAKAELAVAKRMRALAAGADLDALMEMQE